MLERTDRLALAVQDRKAAAETFERIFDARVVDDTDDAVLGAKRLTLQWGHDQLELVEPAGPGAVTRYFEEDKRGIFLGGFALADPAALAGHIERQGIRVHESGPDRFVILPEDLSGTGVILSKHVERERVGIADSIAQISFAVAGLDRALSTYVPAFKLEDKYTRRSGGRSMYGYQSAVIWFDPLRQGGRNEGVLDSLELLDPMVDPDPTVGRSGADRIDASQAVARFVQRNGQGIYLSSIISEDADEIIRRISPNEPLPSDRVIKGFAHPRHLHGLFLGITTYATWNAIRPAAETTAAPSQNS
jgi:hypothetical protein